MYMIDIKSFRKKYNITQKDICDILGVKQPYLSAIESGKRPLSKDKFELLYKHYGNILLEFRVTEPLLPFGTDMEKVQPGAGLGDRLRVLNANLDKATQWQARAEQLTHENEELRAMVDAQQRTIQAHEATIEALKENITLLKEGKAQAKGRVKHVVRSGEGEA